MEGEKTDGGKIEGGPMDNSLDVCMRRFEDRQKVKPEQLPKSALEKLFTKISGALSNVVDAASDLTESEGGGEGVNNLQLPGVILKQDGTAEIFVPTSKNTAMIVGQEGLKVIHNTGSGLAVELDKKD